MSRNRYSLKQKTVLITGASSGIGEACAYAFAEEGANLILAARRVDRLDELKDKLTRQFSGELKIFVAELDVRDQGQVQSFISLIPSEFAPVEVLLNNAGLAVGTEKLHEATVDDWEKMIDTNVKGLLYMSRAVLPQMVENSRGHVINIGSIAGREPYPGGSVYCGTKHAVRAISRSLKMDLLGTNIRVSNVEPGAVETEFSLIRYKGDQDKADKVYEGLKPLIAEDIADAVLYCATCPAHVNVAELLVLANAQASAYHTSRN